MMSTKTKAKRGTAFDKVQRKPEPRKKYMLVVKGACDPSHFEKLGIGAMARSMIQAQKDDGSHLVLTGYQQDEKDIADAALIPAGKDHVLRMSVATLSAHFLDAPVVIAFSPGFDEKEAEGLFNLAMASMYATVEDFAA